MALRSIDDKFEIQTRQEGYFNSESASINTAVAIQTGSDVVSFQAKPFAIYVNGKLQSTVTGKQNLNGGAYFEPYQGNVKIIDVVTEKNDKIRVRSMYEQFLDFELYLNENRKGKVEGLLGNFDGNRLNDLKIRDGAQIENKWESLYPTFSNSWRVKTNFLLHYEPGKTTVDYTRTDLPKKHTGFAPAVWAAAMEACKKAGVTDEPYLSNCAFDYALTNSQNFINSALLGQQNNGTTGTVVGNDINHFKNVKLVLSRTQGNLEDYCLVNFTEGQVYQLKDGAKYANKTDALILVDCAFANVVELFPSGYVYRDNASTGINPTRNIIRNQQWSEYRPLGVESTYESENQNPFPEKLLSTMWNNIATAADLDYYTKNGKLLGADNVGTSTRVAYGDGDKSQCNPKYPIDRILFRIITKEGKRGLVHFTTVNSTATGYELLFDVKIQK